MNLLHFIFTFIFPGFQRLQKHQEAMESSFLFQEWADYSQGTVLTLTPREQLHCKLQESGLSTTHEAQETENRRGHHQIQGHMDSKQAICLWAVALASLKTFNLTRADSMEKLIQKPVLLPTPLRLREMRVQWDLVLTFGKQRSWGGLLCIKMDCYSPRKGSPPPQKLLVIKAWENYA